MKTSHLRPILCLALLLALLAPGCVPRTRVRPQKRSYVLTAMREQAPRATVPDTSLRLGALRVSQRFSSRVFVYRLDEDRFQTDFYHEFFLAPGALIGEETSRWLSESGLFAHVSEGPGPWPPTHLLQGQVVAIYGDFRPGRQPAAFLEIHFWLTDAPGFNKRPLLDRHYRQVIPLQNKAAGSLLQGWNLALAAILTNLEEDLASLIGGGDTR
jgi:cholesterol transport system auxiliary component